MQIYIYECITNSDVVCRYTNDPMFGILAEAKVGSSLKTLQVALASSRCASPSTSPCAPQVFPKAP